jgi:hypothetical protein
VTGEESFWIGAVASVGVLTVWGNVEYWRRGRRSRPGPPVADLRAFSPTIGDGDTATPPGASPRRAVFGPVARRPDAAAE